MEKVIFVLLAILASCQEQPPLKGPGSYLVFQNNQIVRIHCLDVSCSQKQTWSFSKKEIADALRNRAEFEYQNASKYLEEISGDENKVESKKKLEHWIKYYDQMRNSNIDKLVEEQIQNNFSDKHIKDLIFASSDGIILLREKNK